MTADFVQVVDAFAADLTTQVPALSTGAVTLHKYLSWNPEDLVPDGRRHLNIFPVADEADRSEALTNWEHALLQVYGIRVWEPSQEGARQKAEEAAGAEWLQLANDIRARFYIEQNQFLASSDKVWYAGTTFPERAGSVRWFEVRVNVTRTIGFEEE